MVEGSTFSEIATILGLATLFGIIGLKLRQPLVIMFLAAGILAGPSGLGIIQSHEQIELLAQIGITLLLFIVGLKLDMHLIQTTGPVAIVTGLGQIVFTSIIGFLIAITFNMSLLTAAYVAVALTFSSTIIIVKLLSDKKEIDSLHGQIAIGFLIVQDIAAILALVGLTALGSSVDNEGPAYISALIIAAKGLGLLMIVALLMKYVLPYLTKRLAHSLELLTLFAIAWAVLLGAGSEILGFSKEVGAFLAGISLASTEYRESIGARLTTLRDFLLLFFFIDLGASLDWSIVGPQVKPSIILSLFVLIGNPLIVLTIMGLMGYRRRTGFKAGLTVAQISEFSLILAAMGLTIGHITEETVGLITLVGVITIFTSTYMILYSDQLYRLLSAPLKLFEKRNPYREAAIDSLKENKTQDVIIIGLGRYGGGLANYLLQRNKSILGVDFDPGNLDKWHKQGVTVLYGDITDPEMCEHLPLNSVHWIVSTVRSREMNITLVRHLKENKFEGKIALTASSEKEAGEFENAGINLVLRPLADAAEQAGDTLTYAMDVLPENLNWPISFLEVRIRPDTNVTGQTIRDISLRPMTGVSILAVRRSGHVYFEPEPDFRISSGDRLLIVGTPAWLKEAERLLHQYEMIKDKKDEARFEVAEIRVAHDSKLAERSLAELSFRQKYKVTLIGIRRGENQITKIEPSERLFAGDCLFVIGTIEAIHNLKKQAPL
ncbi:MAG: cation:proton antiporter [Bacteroidales bacterium]|nr:cation:proton antiporter [Bacteroidales bacterium]